MLFKNNEERLLREWWLLSPKLRMLLCEIDYWCLQRGEEIQITCFLRTAKEQQELFRNKQAADKISVHQFGRGADFSVLQSEALQAELELWVNEKYKYDLARPGLKTLLKHQGTAWHNHLQVRPIELLKT